MNFGSQDNRVIRGIVLIGDWFSTKTREIDKLDFQSPYQFFFLIKNHVILFRNQYLIYCIEMFIFLTIKKLIFTSVRIKF